DNNGKISGLVPANEALLMKVSDDCGETIYSKNIGPFSTNTDLGNINVPPPRCYLATVTVTGTVVDCNNVAVTNGYVQVATSNNKFTQAINNGSFSISYNHPSNAAAGTLTAYDVGSGDSSVPMTINSSGGTMNVGQIIVCTAITSVPDPVAGFTYSVSSPFVPVTVNFSNTSINATGYVWDFGDGGTSTLVNPSHTYSTAGDYTVKLIATVSGKTDSTSKILHLINQPDAYIILTLNGINYSWLTASDSLLGKRVADTSGSFYTYIQGGGDPWINRVKSISLNIGTGNNTSPGNYPVSILSTLNDTTFTSSFTNATSLTTNVTEYGIVNGYITGTVSGAMAPYVGSGSSNPVVLPFTCSYRVKRSQ
ncbi:MAG TPA: PKD domain-containing protein, partial [Chitinophagaceae bacterium]|nr:PKD domain-containing protein [Chitinophagaceae bacterium]